MTPKASIITSVDAIPGEAAKAVEVDIDAARWEGLGSCRWMASLDLHEGGARKKTNVLVREFGSAVKRVVAITILWGDDGEAVEAAAASVVPMISMHDAEHRAQDWRSEYYDEEISLAALNMARRRKEEQE